MCAAVWAAVLASGARTALGARLMGKSTSKRNKQHVALLGEDRADAFAAKKFLALAPIGRATGISFAGGFMRAFASAAGFLAGMSAALEKPIGDILNVDAISSNSGGSWFVGSLLWSNNFNEMIAEMAAEPASASNIFMARWGGAWKRLSYPDEPLLRLKDGTCCTAQPRRIFEKQKPCSSNALLVTIAGHNPYCCPGKFDEIETLRVCQKQQIQGRCTSINVKHVSVNGQGLCCPAHVRLQKCVDIDSVNVTQDLGRGLMESFPILAKLLFGEGVTWDSFTKSLLEIPGDIDTSLPLSTPSVEWAKGKDLIVALSILTPTKGKDSVILWHGKVLRQKVTMACAAGSAKAINKWPCVGNLCGDQVPARFSVTLGKNSSPINFTSKAVRDVLNFEYRRYNSIGHRTQKREASPNIDPIWDKSYQVPIVQAMAGSSAGFAWFNMLSQIDAAFGKLGLGQYMLPIVPGGRIHFVPPSLTRRLTRLSVPFGLAAESLDEGNFLNARTASLRGEREEGSIAQQGLVQIMDGGQIDNVAISHLVAAGHTNIVSIYNCGNFTPHSSKAMQSFHQLLTGGNIVAGKSVSGFPIFKETMDDLAMQQESFEQVGPLPKSVELHGVFFGTLRLTTVECLPHGIEGGIPVTVRMMLVSSKTINSVDLEAVDIQTSMILGGEVTQALAADVGAARMIDAWFHA